MKPVIIEDKTQRLRDIIEATEKDFNYEVKITPGEAKRIELIRKMKEDTDRKEYMIMLNVLFIFLLLLSAVHYFYFRSFIALFSLISGVLFFMFVRQRLKTTTIQLAEYKNNFDKYLWEGFHLKDMRYTGVKLAYIIFFPLVIFLLSDVISDHSERISIWIGMPVALLISTIGWLVYFNDDQSILDSFESDLKSLEYL